MYEFKDVVVVGGGAAGLECANKLYSSGVQNLVVLEAQDYLGGRIKTLFTDDQETYPLEMGATWIHGHSKVIEQQQSYLSLSFWSLVLTCDLLLILRRTLCMTS